MAEADPPWLYDRAELAKPRGGRFGNIMLDIEAEGPMSGIHTSQVTSARYPNIPKALSKSLSHESTEEKLKSMKGNILVVDDERAFTDMLVEVLAKHLPNFNVYGAYDGQEANLLFDQHIFNLVITDDLMPHMDGFELVGYIQTKKQDQARIVTPGLASMEEIKEFMRLGAAFVVKKPFDIEFLLNKITLCLLNRSGD